MLPLLHAAAAVAAAAAAAMLVLLTPLSCTPLLLPLPCCRSCLMLPLSMPLVGRLWLLPMHRASITLPLLHCSICHTAAGASAAAM
jgi:hypothetical protein